MQALTEFSRTEYGPGTQTPTAFLLRQEAGGAREGCETPFTTARKTLRKKKSYMHNV